MSDDATFIPEKRNSNATENIRPALHLIWHRQASRRGEWLSVGRYRVMIGRDEAVFPGGTLNDRKISRRHVEVVPAGTHLKLVDCGSSNGTFVNGAQVSRRTLAIGDIVRVGDCFFVVQKPRSPGSSQTSDSRLVGTSQEIERVRSELAAAGGREITVLLLGETGTGKDLAAQEIHRFSGRSGQFVAVNCGALPENLLESELFGHIRGAFSGASQTKEGLFQVADEGTIFLDEIGEMSPAVQAKLLRVLQNREIRPLGATRSRPVDTRVVAATNRDLIKAVNDGEFRADLYSRLSQWVIPLPPLREHCEDIPALIDHFVDDPTRNCSPELIEAFLLHSWPFNVRELAGLISLAVLEPGEKLPLSRRVETQLGENSKIALPGQEGEGTDEGSAEQPGRDQLVELLESHRGNVNRIARALGKHRYQIYRWLKAHDLEAADFRAETSG